MKIKRWMLCFACAGVLSACATRPAVAPAAPPSLLSFLSRAEYAIALGQNEQAVGLLKAATAAYPADKASWLRLAQVQFECHNYGDAITHAQQVLERDPDDIVAHSILAASGLRVSSKALADLTIKNNLTGTVRAEAQDLARLVRTSIGGDIIVPPSKGKPLKPMAPGLPVIVPGPGRPDVKAAPFESKQ